MKVKTNDRKAKAGMIAAALFFTVLTIPSIAQATTPPGISMHYGMIGYNGNDSIYMTSAVGSSYLDSPVLGNLTRHGNANTSCCSVRSTYPK